MKAHSRNLATILLAIALVSGVLALLASAQAQSGTSELQHPGLIPYSPSRIEWLALCLQAYYGDTEFGDRGYTVAYVRTGPETITLVVQYTVGVNREAMNMAVESARELVGIEARSRGWSWVQVKEQYKKYE